MLELREKEIFETLKKIEDSDFVVIGGYAVNTYTLPRFSVDCDIVVKDRAELKKIERMLKKNGYAKEITDQIDTPHHGEFLRYEKKIADNFTVSIDILFKNILDRQTNATFSAAWVFKNSSVKSLKGKTIAETLKMRIINVDALIVMKFISCRTPDIRDVLMMIPKAKDIAWIKEEIRKRSDFIDRFNKIKDKIISDKFRDNLQGVYGYISEKVFERHKQALLDLKE